jgi:hypothetical protein
MVNLMGFFSFVNLDVMGLLGSSFCNFSMGFLDGFAVQMCLPPMFVLVSFLSYFIASTCCANGKNKVTGKHAAHSVGVVFLSTATFCIYPSIAMKIFQVFQCNPVLEYGTVSYLQADFSVQCWSKKHMSYVVVSIVCKLFCDPIVMTVFAAAAITVINVAVETDQYICYFIVFRHVFICSRHSIRDFYRPVDKSKDVGR